MVHRGDRVYVTDSLEGSRPAGERGTVLRCLGWADYNESLVVKWDRDQEIEEIDPNIVAKLPLLDQLAELG